MKKTILTIAAVGALAAATLAAPAPAQARGGAFIGGLAAGAVVGGLAAGAYGPYGYGYGYGPGYGYYGSPYYGSYAYYPHYYHRWHRHYHRW